MIDWSIGDGKWRDWLCIYLNAHDWLVQIMVNGCD
jgi:hypothetical protein